MHSPIRRLIPVQTIIDGEADVIHEGQLAEFAAGRQSWIEYCAFDL
jgi:hypothetical protein